MSSTPTTENKEKNAQEEDTNPTTAVKEGHNLLGSPSFTKLGNGRFKCIETGHETLLKDKSLYINSKKCRLGLIDFALSQKKPPLNMFKQDPHCKLKLVCKLTGDVVNKSEEHIWKHINGKRFLNKLELKEAERLGPKKMEEEKVEVKEVKKEKVKKDKKKKKSEVFDKEAIRDVEVSENGSDSEEPEFWCPPVGSRWDNDDGRDRWCSDGEEGGESGDEKMEVADGENGVESVELTKRTKRMAIAVGPSSFASRKKKSKKTKESE